MRFQPSAPRCAWLGVRLPQLRPAQTSSTRSARVGKLLLLVPRLLLHAINAPDGILNAELSLAQYSKEKWCRISRKCISLRCMRPPRSPRTLLFGPRHWNADPDHRCEAKIPHP